MVVLRIASLAIGSCGVWVLVVVNSLDLGRNGPPTSFGLLQKGVNGLLNLNWAFKVFINHANGLLYVSWAHLVFKRVDFKASILALQFCLGICLDHLGRRHELGELWDCQLGNFTAGKDSGGGGNGLFMGELGLQASILALQFCLGTCLDHLGRRHELGELWDCQLGNFTAGKDSGGGGRGLTMGELGLQGKRKVVKPVSCGS
ncbi:hypothetical protein Tco_0971852 [Tanacetum coccineum]